MITRKFDKPSLTTSEQPEVEDEDVQHVRSASNPGKDLFD